jgi:hypothetical protein
LTVTSPAVRLWAFVGLLVLWSASAHAANYTVKQDGTGNFTTIQACADAAAEGDTCVVYAGVYPEYVRPPKGGSSDGARITFRTSGRVTVQGFDIRVSYITVDGFDITGYTVKFSGSISIRGAAAGTVFANNVLRDGSPSVYGIQLSKGSNDSGPRNAVFRNNTIMRQQYIVLGLNGTGHLFEGNRFEYHLPGTDIIRLFGADIVFRRNVFRYTTTGTGQAGHADFIQTFGAAGMQCQNILFEENWIQDLTASQFGQMNSGDGNVNAGILYDNIKNLTFRRNVIINVSNNANTSIPGMRWENNTFYRLAYTQGGIGIGSSLNRGWGNANTFRNNVFLSGGSGGSTMGYYSLMGMALNDEVLVTFVTHEQCDAQNRDTCTIANGILSDLFAKGWIGRNGVMLAKTRTLTNISQFTLDPAYGAYKQGVYDVLTKTCALDVSLRTSFSADYNYVGPDAKSTEDCGAGPYYPNFGFCEPHGINGGPADLVDVNNPLGPDGVPFTLDDGLKPKPTSPLCGRGDGGSDIGAYSCDPKKVFPNQPSPPRNLIIR